DALGCVRSKYAAHDSTRVGARIAVGGGQRPAEFGCWVEGRWPGGEVENEASSIGVHLLGTKYRQILGDRVAKDGTEYANVIASAIAQPNYRFRICLIRDAQPRCKVLVVRCGVPTKIDAGFSGNSHLSGLQVDPTPSILAGSGLGPIDLPAQPCVEGQLGRQTNRVLAVEKQPRLSLISVERITYIAFKVAHVAKQETGQACSSSASRPLSDVIVELKLACAMRVARDSKVICIADVCTKLDRVPFAGIRPIVHEL